MGGCLSAPRNTGPTVSYYENSPVRPARDASGTSSRIPHQEESSSSRFDFGPIPYKAERKARALADALKFAQGNPQLAHYAERVLETVGSSQPTPEISELDGANIATLADTYNTKYSGLNLRCFDSGNAFLHHLSTSTRPSWRAIAKFSPHTNHRVAVDIRTHPGNQKSLIVIESALAYGANDNGERNFLPGFKPLSKNLKKYLGESCTMTVIEADAQKSRIGCAMFALNFALNAFHKSDFFDGIHEELHRNGRYSDDSGVSMVVEGIELIDGTKILPAIFYKHAQSRSTIKEVIKHQPGIAGQNVSTNRDSPHETLSERVQAFRVQREDLSYSMSIEASRMRKIRTAIEG